MSTNDITNSKGLLQYEPDDRPDEETFFKCPFCRKCFDDNDHELSIFKAISTTPKLCSDCFIEPKIEQLVNSLKANIKQLDLAITEIYCSDFVNASDLIADVINDLNLINKNL